MVMHPLDNAIWKALTTSQAHFAESSELARRFPEDISVLGAVLEPSEAAYKSLAEITGQRPVGLLLEGAQPPTGWTVVSIGKLAQMVYEDSLLQSEQPQDSLRFIELSAAESPEMLALAELTKPGPFSRRTHELGRYIGIRQAGKLAAMAGERLCLPGYTEVSAVCTHPDYLGRGYARLLMAEIMQRILDRGEQPFLHVRNDNVRAIELYRRIGFRERAQLHYGVLRYSKRTASAPV